MHASITMLQGERGRYKSLYHYSNGVQKEEERAVRVVIASAAKGIHAVYETIPVALQA